MADRFDAANAEAIAYILGPARIHWNAPTLAEGWPIGVTARHIGLWHAPLAGWITAIKERQPIVVGDIDAINAEYAALGAVVASKDVARLLRERGAAVGDALRDLNDDDLATEVAFGGESAAATVVCDIVVGHVIEHLASIKRTVEEASG